MKNFLYMAAVACLALFASCEKQGVNHTGDPTGKLYGRWVLDTKDIVTVNGTEEPVSKSTDYTDKRFFLGIGESPTPFAAAKEGALISFDINDDNATKITYNAKPRQITFLEALYLPKEGPSMILYDTYDVVDLTDDKLTLRQEMTVRSGALVNIKHTTTYTFHRLVERPQQ